MSENVNIYNEVIYNLKEDDSNPNVMTKEQIKAVANSIKKYGFIIPVVVNKDNYIIDGHQRKKAAEQLNMDEVPVVKLDVDKVDQKLLKQILNKLKGTHEHELDLKEYKYIYEEQGNLDLLKDYVAMEDEYLNNIVQELDANKMANEHTEEELEEAPNADEIKTDIKEGDIIQLGKHRIMCGDSTKKEDVDKLMNGQKVDMVFTDPPYGIDYSGGRTQVVSTKTYGKLKNDDLERESLGNLINQVFNYEAKEYYICVSPIMQKPFLDIIDKLNKKINAVIVWDKKNAGLGYMQYRRRCEFILYIREIPFKKEYKSDIDIWEIPRDDAQSYQHGTQKPIKLVERSINNSSKKKDIVLDLFLGSGSTLIAAEQTGRICYGMELDQKYCEVICQRYEKLYNKEREYIKE